jgi:hypothetical protein
MSPSRGREASSAMDSRSLTEQAGVDGRKGVGAVQDEDWTDKTPLV